MNKLKPFTPFFTFAILLLVTYYLFPLNARVIDSFNQQHGNQQHGNQQYISQQQANQQAEHKVAAQLTEIDRINYLPSLLPMIINNADIIELEPDQLDALIAWRTRNREAVIADMNEIVSLRVAIKQAAVLPNTTPEQLVAFQDEIFRLQRNVLEYKLSCRDLVFDTFDQNNWEGFQMVLADEGYAIEMPDMILTAGAQ